MTDNVLSSNPNDSARPAGTLTKSYVHGACSVPLVLKTLGEVLDEAVAAEPDLEAYILPEFKQTLTITELQKRANSFSKSLFKLGLKKGDTVTVVGYQGSDSISIFFAITQIGCVYYSPYLYNPKKILLEKALRRLESKALIILEEDLVPVFESVAGVISKNEVEENTFSAFPQLKHVIINHCNTNSYTTPLSTLYDVDETVDNETLERAKYDVDVDDVLLIMSSTGTTGEPKFIANTHHNVLNTCWDIHLRHHSVGAKFISATQSPVDDDIYPMYNYVLTVLEFKLKTQLVILPTADLSDNEKTCRQYLETLQDYKITAGYFYPFVWLLIVSPISDSYDLSSLKHGCTGGWRVSEETSKILAAKVPFFTVKYCASECWPMTMGYPDDPDIDRRKTYIGYVASHLQLKIVDDHGKVVPIGRKGEIHVRGPTVFSRYWDDPELTKTAKDAHGWYHTGDVAEMNENGFVKFLGRKAEAVRFKSWGDIVYPGYIEDAIKTHPAVAQSKVIGVPHDGKGHNLCLCLVLKDVKNSPISVEEVEEFIVKKLSKKDIPDYVFFFESFPAIGARKKIPVREMIEICQERIQIEEKDIGELNSRLVE